MKPQEKCHFAQIGMLKFTYKDSFKTKKKNIGEILVMKIQMIGTCFNSSSTHGFFYRKTKISNFWWYLKVSQCN
jgi:hypothetical protein